VCTLWATGWRRCIGCLKLQVSFRKRATNYRALLRKLACKDKASYTYSPPYNRDYSNVPEHSNVHNQLIVSVLWTCSLRIRAHKHSCSLRKFFAHSCTFLQTRTFFFSAQVVCAFFADQKTCTSSLHILAHTNILANTNLLVLCTSSLQNILAHRNIRVLFTSSLHILAHANIPVLYTSSLHIRCKQKQMHKIILVQEHSVCLHNIAVECHVCCLHSIALE